MGFSDERSRPPRIRFSSEIGRRPRRRLSVHAAPALNLVLLFSAQRSSSTIHQPTHSRERKKAQDQGSRMRSPPAHASTNRAKQTQRSEPATHHKRKGHRDSESCGRLGIRTAKASKRPDEAEEGRKQEGRKQEEIRDRKQKERRECCRSDKTASRSTGPGRI
jgi:hypothetical protein